MTKALDVVPELADFQAEVRDWLASILPPRPAPSPDARPDLAVFRNLSDEDELALLNAVRDYRRQRFDAGYGAVTLSVEHGGRGLPASFASAIAQAERDFDVPPSTELISVTTGLVGPAVAMFGSDEQRGCLRQPVASYRSAGLPALQ